MKAIRLLFALALPAITSVGCVATSGEAGDSDEGQTVQEKLVYTLQINEAHKIDFFEYGYGLTGTHETLPVGEVEALRLPDDHPRALAELFNLVRPGDPVPDAIRLADTRAVTARGELQAKLAIDPTFLPAGLSQKAASPDDLGQTSQAAITCSGDFFGDQWGASWFIANFGHIFSNGVTCPSGARNVASFSESDAITNAFTAEVRYSSGRILQWKQMEGDFTNAGSTTGRMVRPGTQLTNFLLWNHSIAPRNISIHTMNPSTFDSLEWLANGVSPCSHLHRAIIWCDRS